MTRNTSLRLRTAAFVLAALALPPVLSACGGSGGSSGTVAHAALPAVPSPTAVPATAGLVVDDWTTFAHDQRRTGFQAQATGLTRGNVGTLALRWSVATGEGILASPLVASGSVYVAGNAGTVRALDARTGTTLWTTEVGGSIAMTPALADGLLFVGDHTAPGNFTALDAATGAVRWRTTFTGGVRGEPVIVDGVVYEGESDGDPPLCNHGGVHALAEQTGAVLWTSYVDPADNDGGSVWSPLSYDNGSLYAGTGNSCSSGIGTANAMLQLDRAGNVRWQQQAANSKSDDDFGGATLLTGAAAIAISKTGKLFALDATSGREIWTVQLGHIDGYGGIASPSSDGHTIVVGAGYLTDPTTTTGLPGGLLVGLDTSGRTLWAVRTQTPISGSVSIANGIGFTPLDRNFVALDITTGATLWSHAAATYSSASPAVVPSGVYFADYGGTVNAFALP